MTLNPFSTVAAGERKFDLDTARRIVGELADLIRPACARIVVAGSIRRGTPYVKDAELVAIPTPDLLPLTDDLVERGVVEKALYGEKQTTRWGAKYRGMLFQGIKVELFLADEDNFGYQFWLRSGPAEANTYLMKWLSWKNAPVRAKDGYWWHGEKRLRTASEEGVFAILGMPYIPPGERSEQKYKQLLQWNRAHRWPDYAPFVVKAPQPVKLLDVQPETVEDAPKRAEAYSVGISPFGVTDANADAWAGQVYAESVRRTESNLASARLMAGIYPSYARRVEVLERELVVLRGLAT